MPFEIPESPLRRVREGTFIEHRNSKAIRLPAIGIKTENTASNESFNSDENNPFAFALGVSKQFKAMKKPILYAQFVYNMDPFKHFGDGQDQLNLDRANVNGSHQKEGKKVDGAGCIDPVDWYDGRGAFRVGIRWDI